MKLKYFKFSFAAVAAMGLFAACEAEIDREGPAYDEVRGDADFSVYVALGNSLTSGYADGSLNRHGQINSYPAIMADKMAAVTPNFEFDQPLLPVGIANGTLEFKGVGPTGQPIIVPASGGLTNEQVFTQVSGDFNNMGVPGAKSFHLVAPGYGSAQGNPYFARFASAENATVVEDAVAQNPTFFTLWIGNNDVLGYALDGGAEGGGEITPVPVFEAAMNAIVDQLVAGNNSTEGAIANIPAITKIPYFSTVRYNQLGLTAEQATLANASYSQRIDPSIDSAATYGVIRQVVTERALREQIIPGVAREIVKQRIMSGPCSDSDDPDACAEAVIASGAADEDIENLRLALTANYFLPAEERNTDYAQAYAIIDAQLANEQTQAAINQNVTATVAAYKAEQLPAENQAALAYAIDSVFNANIAQLKAAGFYPQFVAGPNPFVIEDDNPQNPLGIRQMREGELVLLTALAEGQLTAENAALPKADKYILDANEITNINEAITAYNDIIANLATENTFALVDMNSFFNQVAGGFTDEGFSFSAAFITGNAFSLDGVHLTQRGYALVAKKFIQDINNYYGSKLPLPKLSNYPTLGLPSSVE